MGKGVDGVTEKNQGTRVVKDLEYLIEFTSAGSVRHGWRGVGISSLARLNYASRLLLDTNRHSNRLQS